MRFLFALLLPVALSSTIAFGQSASEHPVLPPLNPWHGESERLMVDADNPWITPAEASGLTRTPSYDETVAWLHRLVDASPDLEMVSIGKSGEQRDIWMVVAARGGARTPQELRHNRKPTMLAHGGIHSGEIDGKDAGLMLLRDLSQFSAWMRMSGRPDSDASTSVVRRRWDGGPTDGILT